MTLHKILSQPNDAHRWENVFERLKRYYKSFPISACKQKNKKTDEAVNNTVDELYRLLPPETVYFGEKELEQMLNKPILFAHTPINALTNQDLLAVAKMLKEEIPKLTFSRIFRSDDFVPEHIVISMDGQPIATLFNPSSCIAFNEYKNKRIASINAIIDLLLSMSMSQYHHFQKNKPLLECLADELSTVQQKSNSKKKVLKQIVMFCYGPSIGIITMRRERAKRLRRKKTNTENVY